jgi:ornithine cyclodeaminase
MPGHLTDSDALAIKVVTAAPRNAERGLPTHLATLLLLDPASGALLAMMDARLITEMRTAAVSAAAVDSLARVEARTLGLIGTGVQARSHLEALRLVRQIGRVRAWSPDAAHREKFASEMAARWNLRVEATNDAEGAVRGADIVVTATTSSTPVVRGHWLSPNACVVAVGASRPDARELDTDVVRQARVFVDSRAAAEKEAGDILLAVKEGAIAMDHVRGEIGEVFASRIPGRTAEGEITVFKSLGQAVEDAAAAKLIYERAKEQKVGTEIAI